MTAQDFRLAFAAFLGAATLCATLTVATLTSACQSARGVSGSGKVSQARDNGLSSRPQDGLRQAVNTPPHTGGKRSDLYAATARVAGSSPDFERSSSPLHNVVALGEAGMASARGVHHEPGSAHLPGGRAGAYLYEVTAYSHGCIMPVVGAEGHARRAANGRWPVADVTVAADTSLHPFGTEVLIEGLGFRTVGDRGHAIKGRRLDLFVDSCREARKFGRRWLAVNLVPPQSTRFASERGAQ